MEIDAMTGSRGVTPDVVDALYEAIKHGDEKHREWLREALDAFFCGKPIPLPR